MSDYHFWLDHVIRASLLTKFIYLLLAFLSVTSWAVIFQKIMVLNRCKRGTRAFRELYRKGRRDMQALYRHLLVNQDNFRSPSTHIFLTALEELQGHLQARRAGGAEQDAAPKKGITVLQFKSILKKVDASQDHFFLELEHYLIHLATTISVAPFLGLLGTVWGILVAFQEMGRQGSTGMTAFGPGISEALVSTVSGLIVAIPALLGYNFIGSRIRELAGEADNFSADFMSYIEKEFVRE